jgi:hypothetical protein
MKLYGFSLSFCVKDMIEQDISCAAVECLITGTNARTKKEWEEVIGFYKEGYWHAFPEQAEAIAWSLLLAGKIYQPRTEDLEAPGLAGYLAIPWTMV